MIFRTMSPELPGLKGCHMIKTCLFAMLALVLGVAAWPQSRIASATPPADEKIKLLIIDGQNNHNYKAMTPYMKASLEKTGRFTVEVATTPDAKAPKEAWEKFRPDFKAYAVILSNYNGQRWPAEVEKAFVQYISDGGTACIVHAANNAFPGWKEYDEMIGLGWRDAKYGERLYLDDEGKEVRQPAGKGPGAGHGSQHAYTMIVRQKDHPVMKDIPEKWMHAQDELYHGQRGPAKNMTILDSAYSDKAKGGTGVHEPMTWVIPYGKGKVFTTLMGHVSGNNIPAIRCVGFQTIVNRGCEWLATGKVTIPVPANFPTADKVVMDP